MNILTVPQGDFTLNRYPIRKKETLRAWDAADEYVLNHLHDVIKQEHRILIINDNFGALSLALHSFNPTVQTDSFLAHQGLLQNLATNALTENEMTILSSMDSLEGHYDVVIIKVPKSHAYLEDILYKIQAHITAETKIISAAMAKNIHTNTLKIYEKVLGETTTSLAKKKARLIFTDFTRSPSTSPYPECFELALEEKSFSICNQSNVFSREKLDLGTRFLLENLPHSDNYKTIVDLGCGNGILGIVTALQHPQAHITFTDESYMAVASAKQNFETAFGTDRKAEFIVSDCLSETKKESVDLILCNPPFHQNTVVGDHIAWQMFNDAYATLNKGGEFWIVGNHHLAYHAKLKSIFGGYKIVASNKKFAVMLSKKT